MDRRSFIKNSLSGAVALTASNVVYGQISTPRDAEGPYYPVTSQADKDADLTRVVGKSGIAQGVVIHIYGQVVDTEMKVIENAKIDIWQANTFGKYHHPNDSSQAPIDENFQAWAVIKSSKDGHFRFKTIMPGAYPFGEKPENQRTPHIHLKAEKSGYTPITTQIYFPGQKQNQTDGLYQRKTPEQRSMMTAVATKRSNEFLYNLILQKH